MRERLFGALLGIVALPTAALAYPEGAPWGAADPDASESCSSCHYDYDPVANSGAISVDVRQEQDGIKLVIGLHNSGAVTMGLQILARGSESDPGRFAANAADLETVPGGVRSTAPRPADGEHDWRIVWRPDSTGPVTFLIAVMAANDDQSPFGDRVHYRELVRTPEHTPEARAAGKGGKGVEPN